MKNLAKQLLLFASGCFLISFGCRYALSEDMQLRNRAVILMDRAAVVSRFQGGPYNVQTEVSFSATASDGSLQGGTYTRVRGTDGGLREDLQLGAYAASRIIVGTQTGWTAEWNEAPYGARTILHLIPVSPGRFDDSDVITSIKDGSSDGTGLSCCRYSEVWHSVFRCIGG